MNPTFFLDTADLADLSAVWSNINHLFSSTSVRGVTTNPNTLIKAHVKDIESFKKHLKNLCGWVSRVRPDGEGVVYVQQPHSTMDDESVIRWSEFLTSLGDGKSRIALKIPCFPRSLRLVSKLSEKIEINVTGITDAATALHCLSYRIRYVSMLFGRMQELGTDSKTHVAFAQQRRNDESEIITGSMRTIEDLKWCCQVGTVPTIGIKVWNQIFDKMDVNKLPTFWSEREDYELASHPPSTTEKQVELSKSFFSQMDDLGSSIYKDFQKTVLLVMHRNGNHNEICNT
ncbi:MAG: hypothetical protein KJ687_00325 [Proteobacteria bacterium]|nr:hypothetical protein [Pseudomonadota bacterium]